MRGRVRLVLPILGLGALLGWACGPRSATWPAAPSPIAEGPILLVTIESIRADSVGGLGGPAGDTPALDRLISEARASGGWAGRAVAPSSWSTPVLASLLTGLESWQHEVLHAGRNVLGPDAPTLPERLAERGWRARAFAQGRRFSPKAGLARGFEAISPTRSNGQRPAVQHLRQLPAGRELVWVHLSRPDSVFERSRHRPATADQRRAEYREYVRGFDRELDRLLAALRGSGRWDEALVAVVACVGQDLDEPGPRGVGGHLERAVIEVPLVVKLPAGAARKVAVPADGRVGVVRLYATLLEAAGVVAPPAVAPSLFFPSVPPVPSQLYVAGGANQFSLVEGDLQLLRRVPLAISAIATDELLRRFQETLPLTGRTDEAAETRRLRWLPGRGTEPWSDPAVEARLAAELDRTWLAWVERERAPSAERWADRTR